VCPEDEALFARAKAMEPTSGTPLRVAFPVPRARAPAPGPPLGKVLCWRVLQDQYSIYLHTEEGYQYSDKDTPEVFWGRPDPEQGEHRVCFSCGDRN